MALTRPRAYQIYDIDYKQAVRVVTISNVTLSGGAPNSVDGVTLSLNDRILVTGQSSAVQNGIYYVTTVGSGANGTWVRSTDTNTTGELLSGTIVMVTEGSTYADTQWKLTTNDPIVIGSTALTFVQNYLANSISFGQTSFAIGSSNANATISVGGTSNVAVYATTGEYITGLISASGNITSAGNISGGNLIGTIATPSQTGITGVGNITTGTWSANTIGLAYGGTGATSAPAAMSALIGYTSTATAAGTTTLTNTSSYYQQFTGATTQTVVLPVTSTLTTGWTFRIVNNSTGSVTVQSSGLNTVIVVIAGTTAMCTCIGTTLTTAADWEAGLTDFSTYTGTGSVVLSASPTLTGTTFVSALSASSTLTGTSTLNLTGSTTSTTSLGTSATTGTTNIGGTSQTGAINIGRSTANQSILIGNSVTGSGNVKTINIGTLGASGSNTNVTIGSSTSGAITTTTIYGNVSAGNLSTTGLISATGNVSGSNLVTAGQVVATGNVNSSGNVAGTYLLGNVFYATGFSASKIYNGTSEINIGTSGGAANISIGGTSNVVVVSSTDVAITGNLSVSGNATLSGNILGDRLQNGTTSIDIQTASGNANISVAGTSNVVVFSSAGQNVTGYITSSGNITGGNLTTAGQVAATGNIDTAGTININSSSGMYNVLNITGTALAPYGGSQTWKFFTQNAAPGGPGSWILFPDSSTQTTAYPGLSSALSLSGNITGGNLIANTAVVASGNVTGGNVITTGLISATGNITGGNLSGTSISGTLTTAAQTNITSVGTLSSLAVTANVAGGNLTTAGQVVATGNVNTSGAFVGAGTGLTGTASSLTVGTATTAGTVTTAAQPNITSVGTLSSLAVTANVAGGNLTTVGQISATGTITTAAGNNSTGFAVGNGAVSNVGLGFFPTAGTRGDYAIRDYSSVFSTIYMDVGMGGSAGGEFQFRSSNAFSLLMRANTTGVYSSGVMSATGAVSGSELSSTNSQTNEGGQINLALPSSGSTLVEGVIIDIYQNNLRFFERGGTNRGAYIDLTAASAGVGTNLLAGSGGGNVAGSNTQVQFNDGGAFGANGQFTYDKVTNTLTAGIIAANNNGSGQNFKVGDDIWIGDINLADTMRLTGQQNGANAYIVFGNADGAQLGRAGTGPLTYAGAFSATGNITGGNLSGTSITGTLLTATQPNITSVGTLSSLTVTANVAGGNLTTAGQVTAVGNISGNYFIGNGSQLTGITSTPNAIVNGTSNVSISSSGGNVTVGVGGSSNVAVFSAGVVSINGLIATPKTISVSGTLPPDTNSQLLSPVTINNGVTITVPDSSTLYITP